MADSQIKRATKRDCKMKMLKYIISSRKVKKMQLSFMLAVGRCKRFKSSKLKFLQHQVSTSKPPRQVYCSVKILCKKYISTRSLKHPFANELFHSIYTRSTHTHRQTHTHIYIYRKDGDSCIPLWNQTHSPYRHI